MLKNQGDKRMFKANEKSAPTRSALNTKHLTVQKKSIKGD
jgi:hypothetical protein